MAARPPDLPVPDDRYALRPSTSFTSGFLSWYFGLHARLARICLQISVVGLLGIVACVLTQIFGRYVLNNAPAWTEILSLVMVLYVTCFAAAVGVRDGRHIGMESLLTLAPPAIRRAADIVVSLGMIGFGAAMANGGAILAWAMKDYINPGLPISQGWSYVPLAVGGFLIVIFAIEHIVASVLKVEVVPSWH